MSAIILHSFLIFLIIFSCLFYGSVTFFPVAIIEIVSAFVVLYWLLDMAYRRKLVFLKANLALALFLVAGVVILQLIPLPVAIVKLFSPYTVNYYNQLTPSGFGVNFLSLSINPDATVAELLKLFVYFSLFLVVVHTIETKRQFSLFVNVIIYFGTAISLFGIVQRYIFPETIYWFDPAVSSKSVFGPFINRNNFSGYINMIIPLTLGYCLTKMQFAKRVVYYCCLGVMCLALFLSLSRAGIIVFIAGIIIFIALSKSKNFLRSRQANSLIISFVLICLLVLFIEAKLVIERLTSLYSKETFFILGHGYSWFDIVKIWLDFPFFGTGLGTFGNISSLYKTNPIQSLFTYAHNDSFQLLSEIGIVGIAAVALYFYLFFYSVIKEWHRRHSSYAVCVTLGGITSVIVTLFYSFLDFNLYVPADTILFFIIMGLVYRLVHSRFKDELAVSG